MVRVHRRGTWGVLCVAVGAGLLTSAAGSALAQSASPEPTEAVPLAWNVDRQRLADGERWLDILDVPSGVITLGRDATGSTVVRRHAQGSWRTEPFPLGADGGEASGPGDGPTRLVAIDGHAMAVGTVDGRLAAWSPRGDGWRRAPDAPVMGLPSVAPGVDAGMATVSWVAEDGDRLVVTGSAACRDCPTSTWRSDDGVRWRRSHVDVDGAELVAVFSGMGRVLGVAATPLPDGTSTGMLVASVDGGPWTPLGTMPVPWRADVQVAETADWLVVVGRDGGGRLGAWTSADGVAWSAAWAEPERVGEIEVRDAAALGPSVLVVGSVTGDVAETGWALWSPDGTSFVEMVEGWDGGCPTAAALTAVDALAVDGGCDGAVMAWRATLPGPKRCAGMVPTIEADAGGGTIVGTPGDDVILGSAGEDRIDGGEGDDIICGGGEHDELIGGPGNDTLLGEADDDLLVPGTGNDMVDGGAGAYDEISYRDAATGIRADLATGRMSGVGDDDVRGVEYLTGTMHADRVIAATATRSVSALAGDDVLTGSAGSETLQGGSGRDRIDGRGGRDELEGGPGIDALLGGGGDDMVVGGSSTDRLRGGPGDDLLFGDHTHDCAEDCSFPFLVLDDRLDGGPGRDTCLDGRRYHCEVIR